MLSAKKMLRIFLVVISSVFLVACNEDLNPSDSDKRAVVIPGSTGNQVGQMAEDFTALDTTGSPLVLTDELTANTAVVLYFTMWCPLCDTHMSSLRAKVEPSFPDIRFLIVDYVSGSVQQSRSAQLSNGYASETVLVDNEHKLLDQFEATMGTTIVIDSLGTIKMNEDYKQSKLSLVLGAL